MSEPNIGYKTSRNKVNTRYFPNLGERPIRTPFSVVVQICSGPTLCISVIAANDRDYFHPTLIHRAGHGRASRFPPNEMEHLLSELAGSKDPSLQALFAAVAAGGAPSSANEAAVAAMLAELLSNTAAESDSASSGWESTSEADESTWDGNLDGQQRSVRVSQ